jgi:hypothetical protein
MFCAHHKERVQKGITLIGLVTIITIFAVAQTGKIYLIITLLDDKTRGKSKILPLFI